MCFIHTRSRAACLATKQADSIGKCQGYSAPTCPITSSIRLAGGHTRVTHTLLSRLPAHSLAPANPRLRTVLHTTLLCSIHVREEFFDCLLVLLIGSAVALHKQLLLIGNLRQKRGARGCSARVCVLMGVPCHTRMPKLAHKEQQRLPFAPERPTALQLLAVAPHRVSQQPDPATQPAGLHTSGAACSLYVRVCLVCGCSSSTV